MDSVGGVEINVTSKEATQIPGISKAGTYNLNPESYMLPSPVEAVLVTGTTKFKLANK